MSVLSRLAVIVAISIAACSQGEPAASAPTVQSGPDSGRREVALFAGGCFWSTEANFEHMPGVAPAGPGFTGPTLA